MEQGVNLPMVSCRWEEYGVALCPLDGGLPCDVMYWHDTAG